MLAVGNWRFGTSCRRFEGCCPKTPFISHQLRFLTSHYGVRLGYATAEARNLAEGQCGPLPFLNLADFRHPICYVTALRHCSVKGKYVSFRIRRTAQGLRVLCRFLIHVVLRENSIRFRNGHGFRSAIVPHASVRMSCPQSMVVDSSQEMERIKVKVKFTL